MCLILNYTYILYICLYPSYTHIDRRRCVTRKFYTLIFILLFFFFLWEKKIIKMVSSEYVVVVFFPPPRGRASPAPRVNEEGCNPSCSHRVKSGSRCQMCWGQSGGRAAEEIPTPTADRSSVPPLSSTQAAGKASLPLNGPGRGRPCRKAAAWHGEGRGGIPTNTPHCPHTHRDPPSRPGAR